MNKETNSIHNPLYHYAKTDMELCNSIKLAIMLFVGLYSILVKTLLAYTLMDHYNAYSSVICAALFINLEGSLLTHATVVKYYSVTLTDPHFLLWNNGFESALSGLEQIEVVI